LAGAVITGAPGAVGEIRGTICFGFMPILVEFFLITVVQPGDAKSHKPRKGPAIVLLTEKAFNPRAKN
jgi:hypothetical protein